MWKISGYEHPGGGMSWTERGKINKWNPFFHRFDTATPDHRFSPPTPSACNHLGRGHVPWVVQVLLVLWVFLSFLFFFLYFKSNWQNGKELSEGRTEHRALNEAQNILVRAATCSASGSAVGFFSLCAFEAGRWRMSATACSVGAGAEGRMKPESILVCVFDTSALINWCGTVHRCL